MDWMAETAARRGSPQALWPEAHSVIMLGVNYAPAGDPLATLANPRAGSISVYARNRDYHELIKGRLKELAGLLAQRTGAARRVHALVGEPGQGLRRDFQAEAPLGEAPGEPVDLELGDAAQLVLRQGREDDQVVEAVEELRF